MIPASAVSIGMVMFTSLLLLPLLFPVLAATIGWVVSAPGHVRGDRGRAPDGAEFDGRKFRNRAPIARDPGALRKEGWPKRLWPAHIPERRALPPNRSQNLRATWVNHATVLVQIGGINVLTDPVWSSAAGPLGQLGPRRRALPGVRFEDLPPIDLVLLSHNHYDHLDVPTMMRLWKRDKPKIYTGLGTGALLRRSGLPAEAIIELDWWESANHARGVTITATEARHFSGRGLFDRDRTLWVGLHLKTPAGSVYFGGDSGYGPHYAETARRLGAPTLALLPIGAFLPRAMMQPVHLDPAEAVMAHQDLGATLSLGVHWGTFALGADSYEAPRQELARAREAAGVAATAFVAVEHGDALELGNTGVHHIPAMIVHKGGVVTAPVTA